MLITFFSLCFSLLLVVDLFLVYFLPVLLSLLCVISYMGFFDGFLFFDFLGILLVFVCVWIFSFSFSSMFLSSISFCCFFFMLVASVFCFSTSNFLLFYVSFEFIFVVMFFFLLGWGKTPERFQASFYMLFYTLVFSFPFLIMLVDIFFSFSGCFFLLGFFSYFDFFWFFMFLVFIVKLPLFGFHLWLPKAHVEAPVSGSMLLAGVFLKLGGYGIIRFSLMPGLFSFSFSLFVNFLFYLSLYGSFFVSIICVRLMDLKMIIAYSSVVHMSVMALGIFSFSFSGVWGAAVFMVSHGFVSPLLFFLMTEAYSMKHSRSLMLLKGFLVLSPVFCLFWFLGCSLNMSLPPFMSFFSEVVIIGSMGFLGLLEWVFIMLGCFFVGVYCIFMYSFVSYGVSFFSIPLFISLKVMLLSFSHLFFVFFFPVVFFSN